MKKRIVFTGGSGKAGKHVVPWLMAKGYEVLNVDLKKLDHPGVRTFIADLTDSGQAFNALSVHFDYDGFDKGGQILSDKEQVGAMIPDMRGMVRPHR